MWGLVASNVSAGRNIQTHEPQKKPIQKPKVTTVASVNSVKASSRRLEQAKRLEAKWRGCNKKLDPGRNWGVEQ